MKKQITLTFLALGFISANAQNNIKLQVAYYQIDNMVTVETTRAKPNSKVDYYAKYDGGQYQTSNTANEMGVALLTIPENAVPAFSLNDKFVQHLGDREFLIKEIEVKKFGTLNKVSWKGNANPSDHISFVVLRKNDHSDFKEVYKVVPNDQHEVYDFQFVEPFTTDATYKIVVIKNDKQERYSARINQFDNQQESFMVYPTMTTNEIHIDFTSKVDDADYSIMSNTGQLLSKGKLNSQQNTIQLSQYPKGIYFLDVNFENSKKTTKISLQ